MVGSGEVKLARAAGMSIKDTAKAGLYNQLGLGDGHARAAYPVPDSSN